MDKLGGAGESQGKPSAGRNSVGAAIQVKPHSQTYHNFVSPAEAAQIAALLMVWYRRFRRRLPWRLPYTLCSKHEDPQRIRDRLISSLSPEGRELYANHVSERNARPFLEVVQSATDAPAGTPKLYLQELRSWAELDERAETYLDAGYRAHMPASGRAASRATSTSSTSSASRALTLPEAIHAIVKHDPSLQDNFVLSLSPEDRATWLAPVLESQFHDRELEEVKHTPSGEQETSKDDYDDALPPNDKWTVATFPYGVWVSEIMLQQTRVETVKGYYRRWLRTFPTVHDLANAPDSLITQCWAGLGYYRRSRLLKEGSKFLIEVHRSRPQVSTSHSSSSASEINQSDSSDGQASARSSSDTAIRDDDISLPPSAAALRLVPGIGPYTAGAIASLAYGLPEPIVDGNVYRVLARLRGLRGNPQSDASMKNLYWKLARDLVGSTRGLDARILERFSQTHPWVKSGFGRDTSSSSSSTSSDTDVADSMHRFSDDFVAAEFNQAMMELGATVCVPIRPLCTICPVRDHCHARREFEAASRPFSPEYQHVAPGTLTDIEDLEGMVLTSSQCCTACEQDEAPVIRCDSAPGPLPSALSKETPSKVQRQTSINQFFQPLSGTNMSRTQTNLVNEDGSSEDSFSVWAARYPGPKPKKSKVIANMQSAIVCLEMRIDESDMQAQSEDSKQGPGAEQILFVRSHGTGILTASRQFGSSEAKSQQRASNNRAGGSGSALLEGQWCLPSVVLKEEVSTEEDENSEDDEAEKEVAGLSGASGGTQLGRKRSASQLGSSSSSSSSLSTMPSPELQTRVAALLERLAKESGHEYSVVGEPLCLGTSTHVFSHRVHNSDVFVFKVASSSLSISLRQEGAADTNEEVCWANAASACKDLGLSTAVAKQVGMHTREVSGRAAVSGRKKVAGSKPTKPQE